MNQGEPTMNPIRLLAIAVLLFGCVNDSDPRDGGLMTGPQGIIETGYLSCAPNPDACTDQLSCETANGEQVLASPHQTMNALAKPPVPAKDSGCVENDRVLIGTAASNANPSRAARFWRYARESAAG